MIKFFSSFLFFFIITACSSIKEAGVVYHDSFDFSAVKSYSLYERNSLFSETQNLRDTRRNAFEIAIERTMAKQKFSYEVIEKADLIVTYYLFDGNRKNYAAYNKVVHFCTHCLRATTWKTEKQYSSMSRGSLVLDLVDPKQNRSVWRSVYSLDLNAEENSADTNDRIKQAVSAMLAEYPTNHLHRKFTN
mgnify:CR=1 FL=1